MARANLNTQRVDSNQFYIDFLVDAAAIFEDVISRLNHCDHSQCDVVDAMNMAHRIKGNAAMYDYPDLGIRAAAIEQSLRSEPKDSDHAPLLSNLIDFVEEIHEICRESDKVELSTAQVTLAVAGEDTMQVSQSAAVSSNRKSIIFAYQDDLMCELVTNLLGAEYDVTCVNSGAETLRAIKDRKVELVAMEDFLGDMSALDIVRELKASDQFRDLPLFLAFNPDSPELVAEAIGLGVDGFTENKHNVFEFTDFAKKLLDAPSRSILVVDDDQMVRKILKYTLTSAGYKVDSANDGQEALSYLKNKTPDLILLDKFMPRLEGGSVLHEIQNKINLKSIPVLILTAMVNHGEAESWFQRGAADFIPKPFDPAEVLMRVEQHLSASRRAA